MRVSLDWIKEFVDLKASAQEVADRLTMAGLEIEGMEKVGDDVVMEVNVTPNRPDCLSILGVAREAAAAFCLPLRLPLSEVAAESGPCAIAVEINDTDLCHRYAGRQISGVRISQSPEWLRSRLEKCGIRSINNIVDVTNYILLEFGHPLHAFDSSKVAGSIIRVARAGEGRSMMTLDNVERDIPEDTLLIWDGAEPVAIAGIMGGERSSVTETTTDIFLESAYFNPASIRKSSKLLGLRSESSYRFERGTDIIFLEAALNRAALLIAELGGGKISSIVDAYPITYSPIEITVPYSKINRLIGIDIPKKETLELLNNIGITAKDSGDYLTAVPPSFRGDVTGTVDIIEEVARCYGYSRIPARPPKAALTDASIDIKAYRIRAVRETVRKSGFDEVVNFSFMNSADLDLLSIIENIDEPRRKHLMLKNPLRQEECLMRTTLVPALLRNFIYNLSRGINDIRIFELSRVFIHHGSQLPEEELNLAGLYFSDNTSSLWEEQSPPFYIVKGVLEAVLKELRLQGISFRYSDEAFLHPGKSADIYYGDRKLGYIGEFSPKITERLELKIKKPQIIVFEVNIGSLVNMPGQKVAYEQIPRYPAIERDVAMILDDQVTAYELVRGFREFRSDIIENAVLFDHYRGKNLPEGKKSLGVRVTYRSKDRTLTETEIEPVHALLVESVSRKTGAKLRGTA